MKRHDFAPHIVPPDAGRFLAPPTDPQDLPDFYKSYKPFYQFCLDYCFNSIDNQIIRDVDGTAQNFSNVIASQMTRSKEGRQAIVLRSTVGEFEDTHYRLFIRPYDKDEITEYEITETRYNMKDDHFPSGHYSLYLATDLDGKQGVLEVGSDGHHTSIWSFDGSEYILENMPYLVNPDRIE